MREKSLMRYIEARKHGRGWEGAAPKFEARRGVRRGCPRVGAASKLFFFFSLEFTLTWLQFTPNRAVSTILGRIGRRLKRPKQAKIGIESS